MQFLELLLLFPMTVSLARAAAPIPPERIFVTHDDFPNSVLSVQEPTQLGVDTVRQYSGYLDGTSGHRMFYWFFESRNDPKHDPVMLWLNGGPGCSSMQAVLFENGPASIDSDLRLSRNPYSWNNNASVIYLDQPINVGFSEGQGSVSDTPTAANDVYAFLTLFFKQFPQYAQVPFHISGESYAGRYIPTFAERIMGDYKRTFNVSSVLIGNGLVDVVSEYKAYQPMLCGQGGSPSKLDQNTCANMRNALPACTRALQNCVTGSDFQCNLANFQCNTQLSPWQDLNPYDIRDASCQDTNAGLCYPGMDWVTSYFNQPSVRSALGADNVDYQVCNNQINANFQQRRDEYHTTTSNVTSLLHMGVATLVYSGDKDIICNWLGGRDWTSNLQWQGQTQFQQAIAQPQKWHLSNGQQAGEVSNFDHFTFLRVYNAGHMVPHDQPHAALEMVQRWLHGDFAFDRT